MRATGAFIHCLSAGPRVFTTLLVGVSESACEICADSFFFFLSLGATSVFDGKTRFKGPMGVGGGATRRRTSPACLIARRLCRRPCSRCQFSCGPDKKVISRRLMPSHALSAADSARRISPPAPALPPGFTFHWHHRATTWKANLFDELHDFVTGLFVIRTLSLFQPRSPPLSPLSRSPPAPFLSQFLAAA